MFERPQLQLLKKRIEEPRRFIQVLAGPRQVGKTTLALQLVKQINIPYIIESADAVPAGNAAWLEQIWETARLKMRMSQSKEFLLVIDEVQKINNWSEMIKSMWDTDTRNDLIIKILLLGSSRLLIQQGLTESLAGRFEMIHLNHWSFDEMQKAFGWNAEKFAWFGSYPGAAELISDENRWKKYIRDSLIESSISRDILMLTRVDKPSLMKNLFELGCQYSGQILSYTKIIGQLQDVGNTTTLAHYLNLLDTAGLLGGIEKYAADIIRIRSSSPKFQVYNNALLSAQKSESFNDTISNPKEWGRIVESAIGEHLINHSAGGNYSIYYWRDKGDEVDFVLERQGKIVAIEVKSTLSANNKGFATFNKKYAPHKVYLIDNRNLTWQEFLKINPGELF